MKKPLLLVAFLLSALTDLHAINLEQAVKESKGLKGKPKLEYLSRQFHGSDYARTLSRWPSKEEFSIDLDRLDCMTYVEYVLALDKINDFTEFHDAVRKIRYKDGQIDYKGRNHFFVDWLDNNPYLENVTSKFQGSRLEMKQLSKRGLGTKTREICYLPLKQSYDSLETGDFVGFYTSKPGLDVIHTGIIIKKQEPWLRHFSIKGYQEIQLKKWLNACAKKRKIKGLIVARPRNQ